MPSKEFKLLGILGGLGPAASAYFYEMITDHTKADCDQDHIDMIISSKATIPDRTDFILGKSKDNPGVSMKKEIDKMIGYGADLIAVPCNTAHYFFDIFSENENCSFLNMVEESVSLCSSKGIKRIGLLATKGTVDAGIYAKVCDKFGMELIYPEKDAQDLVMAIIYDQIKAGKPADPKMFEVIEEELKDKGCEKAILGCTELSVAKKQLSLSDWYLDSMEVLAYNAIVSMGKTPIGFEDFIYE